MARNEVLGHFVSSKVVFQAVEAKEFPSQDEWLLAIECNGKRIWCPKPAVGEYTLECTTLEMRESITLTKIFLYRFGKLVAERFLNVHVCSGDVLKVSWTALMNFKKLPIKLWHLVYCTELKDYV